MLNPAPTRLRLALAALALLMANAGRSSAGVVPSHDRVIVVVMENKSYDQVRTQPYTLSLMALGATFTNSFGIAHPSQPNYLAIWAGSTLGVTSNTCPAPLSPFLVENLGHACESAGLSWRAYSENLPAAGSDTCSFDGNASTGLYARKHAPWTQFENLNHANERPYTDLAVDLAANTLPNLSFIIPNNCHNSHNSTTAGCTVPDADTWLSANMPEVIAKLGPRGLLVLTWDEDDNSSGNHILTVAVGTQVTPGAVSSQMFTQYTLNRMICDALGLAPFGLGVGEVSVAGIWAPTTSAQRTSWGRLKAIYR